MSLALASLLALVAIIIISCIFPKINPGLLAIIAAITIGTILADMSIKSVLSGFPADLFLLLLSICAVFGIAQANGTLPALVQKVVPLIRGRAVLVPLLLFGVSFVFSAMGPGNIAAVALLATIAMTMAARYQISPLLIAIMVVTGANAGAFSPFAPTGVIASGLMDDIGLDSGTLRWVVFGAAAVLQSLTALGAYTIYLARRRRREVVSAHTDRAATRKPPVKRRDVPASSGMVLAGSGLLLADAGAGHGSPTLLPPRISGPMNAPEPAAVPPARLTRAQWATLGLIVLMIGGVVLFDAPLVLMACVVVALMSFADLGDFERVMRDLPWGTILMVTGIALLIGLMEKTGGLDLATTLIASVTRPEFINAALAFITGVVSAFSSSSGVVMPAFIPLVPSLAEKMGIIDSVVKMVISVCVGSHMVDVSPLSTLGALALSAIPIKAQRDKAFRGLLIWGMSMAVVGAVLAFIFLDLL